MATDPNSSAHPTAVSIGDRSISEGGLTKREYFASAALQGLLADPNRDGHLMGYAEAAVRVADMLVAELNKAGA